MLKHEELSETAPQSERAERMTPPLANTAPPEAPPEAQRMTQPTAPGRTHRQHHDLNAGMVGAILIVVGLFSLLAIYWPSEIIGLLVLPAIGVMFLVWAYLRRSSPLLVPGCILTGLGLGTLLQQTWLDALSGQARGGIVMLGLGLGFLSIMPLVLLMDGHTHWWPAVPGAILLAVSLGLLAGPGGVAFLQALNVLWPIALIVVGAYLLWLVYMRRGDRPTDRERHGLPS